jgi:hypothetical protein
VGCCKLLGFVVWRRGGREKRTVRRGGPRVLIDFVDKSRARLGKHSSMANTPKPTWHDGRTITSASLISALRHNTIFKHTQPNLEN